MIKKRRRTIISSTKYPNFKFSHFLLSPCIFLILLMLDFEGLSDDLYQIKFAKINF